MNSEERARIDDWAATVSEALGHAELPLEVDDILDLAGVAARNVVRPAAPLTTFIAGYAAGHAAAGGTGPAAAMAQAIETATAAADAASGE
ncbi:MAG TPA: DUF6457 domain-containing protein [Terrimesophilobacter sp.]|nr:DUF6457 domain-containing protein [Terrimesophilobacter sp.]HRP98960.1 DUF6457 domain-containing protein [Terrimesophilobacter sp.]